MKSFTLRYGRHAFTLVEMFVVVAVFAVVMVVLLPELFRPRRYGHPYRCINNLKQIGLAFRTWEGDNNDLYPMRYFTNNDGSAKYADTANCFRYFQVMSNELNNPYILVCPTDNRKPAKDFTNCNNSNLSYFAGLDTDETRPATLLAGDRNLTNGTKLRNGVLELTTNRPAGFTGDMHNGIGHILLSDGSVQQVDAKGLNAMIANTGLATNRLVMP